MNDTSSIQSLEDRIRDLESRVEDRDGLEQALRESRETADGLMSASADRTLLLDTDGCILCLNRPAAEGLGGSPEALIGRNAFDLFSPELARRRRHYHDRAVQTGEPVHYEDQRDGRWLETRLQPIRDSRGTVARVAVLSRDITERFDAVTELQRHRDHLEEMVTERTAELTSANAMLQRGIAERRAAEEGLRRQQAWLESLVLNSSLAIVTVDEGAGVISFNAAFERLFGFDEREMVGRRVDDLITCDRCRSEAKTFTEKTLSGLAFQETAERHRKDGSTVEVEIFGVPVVVDGRIIGAYGVYRELSDLRAAERALKESEELFRVFAEDAPFGMSIMNTDRIFEYFNPKFTEIFGYTLEDLPDKKSWFEKAYPDPEYRATVRSVWEKDSIEDMKIGEIKPRIFRVTCRNGEDKTIHFRAVMTRNRKQLMTYEDITARARAEEALRQSEERYRRLYEDATRREQLYRSLLQSSADAVVIYDMEGTVQYVSPTFTRLFGWTLDELAGKRISFVPESERGRTMAVIMDLLEHGTPCSGFETIRADRQGKRIQVSISASRYDDHDGNPAGMLVILRDISAQKQLESRLSQAHKMEAIGTLAGGIAHDFNNILQAISGYTQLLLMKKDTEHPDYEKLVAIERSARRAAELTERLLIFGRKKESHLQPVDLNQEIGQAIEILGRTIPKMIRIETDLEENLGIINGDPVQLEQVAMNIAVNARDAMSDGGRLRFRTRGVRLDDDAVLPHPDLPPGEYVLFEISDTGCGMDAETLEHIYEPFFTTKPMGEGTGLGLAMVYGIVKSHGGAVVCSSREGEGTVFCIYFPVLPPDQTLKPKRTGEGPPLGGDERILLVDDEQSILDIGCDILGRYGYDPMTAKSGEEALEIYRKDMERIDLVILDLNMPGMGGKKCLEGLRDLSRAVKVVVATGHTSSDQAREVLELGATRFVPKPYRLKDLLKIVREVLDEDGS